MSWRDSAACRDTDPDLFFPHSSDHESRVRALAICEGCPVRQDCLDDAMANPSLDHHGIFGGTTPAARRKLRRRLEAVKGL